MNDDQIKELVNRMERDDWRKYNICYNNDIFTKLDDSIDEISERINEVNVYHLIHDDIVKPKKKRY